LTRVADIIERGIDAYVSALRNLPTLGQWEAPVEGWSLGWLVIRNVEAVIAMARHDEVMVNAAWSNTRVAFEQSVRIVWMLHPNDRFEAECRWLAFLEKYERFERAMVAEVPDRSELHSSRAEAIRGFRLGVAARLPEGYTPLRPPRFRDMLTAIGNPQLYQYYREGSQYVHGSMHGSSSYRRNLGTARDLGDFTSTVDWVLPLRLAWLAFQNAADIVLVRLDLGEADRPDWDDMNRVVDESFASLAHSAVSRLSSGSDRE
jgi:hypothetical protein